MQVFDKIIPQGYADQIEADLRRTQFDWHYISDVTNRDYGSNSGFVHIAHDMGAEPSFWLPFIKPIIYSIEEATNQRIEQLLRIRVGLLTKTSELEYTYNTPHVDFLFPHTTACYYVNDSDGDTVEFVQHRSDIPGTELNETVVQQYVANTNFTVAGRCSPKKGRLCVFDGLNFHASTKPKLHDTRMVITINYIPYAS
jgi:hypothetical protein